MAYLDDRWLYLGFGAFLFAATHLISHGLTIIADLNTISPASTNFGQAPTPSTPEDSLALATLSSLATSPNADISRSSILLLLTRLAKSPSASQSLIDDLFSPSPDVRRRARNLELLYARNGRSHALPTAQWWGLLDLSVDSGSQAAMTVRAVYWHARALAERGREGAMRQLARLAGEMMDAGSGVVLIWPAIKEVQVVAWMNVMGGLGKVGESVVGTERFLRAVRILDGVGEMDGDPEEAWLVVLMRGKGGRDVMEGWSEGRRTRFGFEDIDGDRENLPLSRAWDNSGRRPRFHEESSEIAAIRRRRREAMVLHEGDGVLHRGNIIEL